MNRPITARLVADVPKAPPDLRLGSAAAGAWLGVLAGGLLPTVVCWSAAGCLLALGAVARRSTAMATGLVLLAAGVVVAAVARSSLTHGPAAALARRAGAAHVELTVSSDPQPVAPKPFLPPEVVLHARLRVLETSKGRWTLDLPVLVIAPASSWKSLLPSTRVAAAAVLQQARGIDVAALLVIHRSPVLIRGPSALQRWAGRIRAGLRRAAAHLPRAERGLLPGLVVGDTSAMPVDETADFRARRAHPSDGGERGQSGRRGGGGLLAAALDCTDHPRAGRCDGGCAGGLRPAGQADAERAAGRRDGVAGVGGDRPGTSAGTASRAAGDVDSARCCWRRLWRQAPVSSCRCWRRWPCWSSRQDGRWPLQQRLPPALAPLAPALTTPARRATGLHARHRGDQRDGEPRGCPGEPARTSRRSRSPRSWACWQRWCRWFHRARQRCCARSRASAVTGCLRRPYGCPSAAGHRDGAVGAAGTGERDRW